MDFFDLPIVSLAISVIVAWALFAIFCSLIFEAFAQLKAERGRYMRNYIFQQLKDLPNGINWGSLVYAHGKIDLLSRDDAKPTNDINSRLFAETLVDVVANAQIVKMKGGEMSFYKDPTLSNFKKATQSLLPSDQVNLLAQSLRSAEAKIGMSDRPDETLIYNELVSNLELWFTELTERLTLWYKKKTRRSLLVVGFVLALFLNIDSVQLMQEFKANPELKNTMIEIYERSAPDAIKESSDKKALLRDLVKSIDSLKNAQELPIGFENSAVNFICSPEKRTGEEGPGFWIWKLLGLLTSAFAASFGGPFWFDTLKKIYEAKK